MLLRMIAFREREREHDGVLWMVPLVCTSPGSVLTFAIRCRAIEGGCVIGDRWGVTDDEVSRHYPCDDAVSSPSLQAWRGATVHAAPGVVWPWVTQIQWAPYSYDWIDNLGHRSPRRLLDTPAPVPGEHFTSAANRPLGRLLSVEPQVHYTGRILDAVMSYLLVPAGEDTTRLLLKIVMSGHRWFAPALSVGDLVMARRQLLNIKRLAERRLAPP
jgi:hypothetical protein